jgi:adenylate cyclase
LEFESAVNATPCTIEIQQNLHEHNLNVADSDRFNVRIGIHVGDVVNSGADVFGDAVNVASRIESFADPGGVCITEPVFLQVRNRVLTRLPNWSSRN